MEQTKRESSGRVLPGREVNKYDSRWYSVRSDRMGKIVARVGKKVDNNGDISEKSDTRQFDTVDEAMKFVSEFLGY